MALKDPSNRRQRTLRVEAVVIHHSDWGEADRFLRLYTLEMGKIRAIAKGVRKPRSRKAGHLEPFTRTRLLLARGREIPLVTQAETINAFLALQGDLERSTYASYVVELLDRFTYEEEENQALYRLITDTLQRICQSDNLNMVTRYYEMRLLDHVGFRPQLFKCVGCDHEIQPQDQFFSAQQGGVLCPDCGSQTTGSRSITMQALRYLRHFQRSNYGEASRARLDPSLNREIETIIQNYLTFLLERSLNTPPFFHEVRTKTALGNSNDADI